MNYSVFVVLEALEPAQPEPAEFAEEIDAELEKKKKDFPEPATSQPSMGLHPRHTGIAAAQRASQRAIHHRLLPTAAKA